MQMREKLRKITEAAKHHEQISEQSKTTGMRMFFVIAGIGLLLLVSFSLALLLYKHYIGAFITLVITAGIGYFLYKIQSADDIPED